MVLNEIQAWTDAALAPTPTVRIRVRYGLCPYQQILARGCANYDPRKPIGNIVMDASLRDGPAKRVFFHELTHVFDGRQMYAADRQQATSILGFPAGTPWQSPVGDISPSEWFAEAGMRCYMGANPAIPAYKFKLNFDDPQVLKICDLMDRAALNPPRQWFRFNVSVPPGQMMVSAATFEAGEINATIRSAGRSVTSNSSCFATLRTGTGTITVGTCNDRVQVWSRSSRRATLNVWAVPSESLPSKRFTYSKLYSRRR